MKLARDSAPEIRIRKSGESRKAESLSLSLSLSHVSRSFAFFVTRRTQLVLHNFLTDFSLSPVQTVVSPSVLRGICPSFRQKRRTARFGKAVELVWEKFNAPPLTKTRSNAHHPLARPWLVNHVNLHEKPLDELSSSGRPLSNVHVTRIRISRHVLLLSSIRRVINRGRDRFPPRERPVSDPPI